MKLPKYTKNFYFLSGMFFLVWLLFIDSNDLINQFRLTRQLNGLEKEKAYYQEKIIEVEKERKKLLNDPLMLEKYAREKYLMKKPNEDIYVVVEE
ncbi:MAG: FtsB family cell division protein [Candidatus Cyclobacteriaceae bacterium M2_1C_046]